MGGYKEDINKIAYGVIIIYYLHMQSYFHA